jgi:hypothetical protein
MTFNTNDFNMTPNQVREKIVEARLNGVPIMPVGNHNYKICETDEEIKMYENYIEKREIKAKSDLGKFRQIMNKVDNRKNYTINDVIKGDK